MIPVLTVDGREFQAKMLCNDPTWIARLPFDNILRPSTLSGSKDAAIQVSHKIMFCLTFIPKGYHKDGQALYTAQWPILLSSVGINFEEGSEALNDSIFSHSAPVDGGRLCYLHMKSLTRVLFQMMSPKPNELIQMG
jgi:hypothetical protein